MKISSLEFTVTVPTLLKEYSLSGQLESILSFSKTYLKLVPTFGSFCSWIRIFLFRFYIYFLLDFVIAFLFPYFFPFIMYLLFSDTIIQSPVFLGYFVSGALYHFNSYWIGHFQDCFRVLSQRFLSAESEPLFPRRHEY